MKLKEQTFAIIAEKKDSISHRWFISLSKGDGYLWTKGDYYVNYGNGKTDTFSKSWQPKHIPIYTESQFEALLKAEQENEAKEITQEFKDKFTGGVNEAYEGCRESFQPLTEMPTWSKTVGFEEPKVIISYQTAIDLLACYTKIDKGIIKIEMP